MGALGPAAVVGQPGRLPVQSRPIGVPPHAVRPIPFDRPPADRGGPDSDEMLGINPELADAIQRLSVQQRTVVTLVHAFGWTQRDVAQLLELNPSTVREHLDRALTRLTHDLEVRGVR